MTESQKVEQAWDTPTLEEIPKITAHHVKALEDLPDNPDVWGMAGMWHVLLRFTGRKSGEERKCALPIWRDPEGHPIVVASYAGAPAHPTWFLNITDKTANPELEVKEYGKHYWADVEVLDGDDYEKTWAALTEDRNWYRDYQAKTDRRIPLVRLREKRPA